MENNEEQIPVSAIVQPTPQPEILQEPEEIFLVYRDENLGIELEYLKEWFVYNEATWVNDNAVIGCSGENTMENTLILSRRDLGTCVEIEAFNAWPGDFLVSFSEGEWSKFPSILAQEQGELIEIGGIPAVRYLFSEDSSSGRKQAVRMYMNTADRGYIMEFTQNDLTGNYDSVFDELVSSIRFIES